MLMIDPHLLDPCAAAITNNLRDGILRWLHRERDGWWLRAVASLPASVVYAESLDEAIFDAMDAEAWIAYRIPDGSAYDTLVPYHVNCWYDAFEQITTILCQKET